MINVASMLCMRDVSLSFCHRFQLVSEDGGNEWALKNQFLEADGVK